VAVCKGQGRPGAEVMVPPPEMPSVPAVSVKVAAFRVAVPRVTFCPIRKDVARAKSEGALGDNGPPL